MRARFDKQLQQLNHEMIQMGALCEDAIALACDALGKNDVNVISRIKQVEQEIDRKEDEIQTLCMGMLLQQQPVASDLRNISAALKMISDMERIGDQAVDITEITQYIQKNEWRSFVHIKQMAEKSSSMLSQSIDSFVRRDVALARDVMAQDDAVDALFCNVKQELVDYIAQDKENGEHCIDLMMVAKYFERIADHATNIAEWVVFSIIGEKA